MGDIMLSVQDRKRLVELLAALFPNNTRADTLLELVRYPLRNRPIFDGKPIVAWQETFADFDQSGSDDTPYAELLVGIARIYPLETELVELTVAYRAADRTTSSQPRVLAVGADDGLIPTGTAAQSWSSRELAKIRDAEELGCISLDVCSAASLDPERLRTLAPQILHVNGRYDDDQIRFDDGIVAAERLRDCLDRCLTDHGVRIELLVFGGGDGEHLRKLFRRVADCIVTHDKHVDDELSIRFTSRLYKMVSIAPSFPTAVDAAHLFVLDETYRGMDSDDKHLRWPPSTTNGQLNRNHEGTSPRLFAPSQQLEAILSSRSGPGPADARRVHVMRASPRDRDRLRGDLKAIRAAAAPGHIDVTDSSDAGLLDLRAVLDPPRPDILHISGHGERGRLVFEDIHGEADAVPVGRVVELLAAYRGAVGVRLSGIVLNSCDSAEIAAEFRPVADVVIAHNGPLDDGCAAVFTSELYSTLRTVPDLAAAAQVAATHCKDACPQVATNLVCLRGTS